MPSTRSHNLPRLVLLVFALVLALPALCRVAEAAETEVYFFYGEECPYCVKEKAALNEMQTRYPGLRVNSLEIWHDPENAELFSRAAKAFGMKAMGVPTTVVGRKVWVGFSDDIERDIEEEIKRCLKEGCPPLDEALAAQFRERGHGPEEARVRLPFFGEVRPAEVSLPAITLILAALDSFNPCAFFVLFTLLSLMVHARSRPRMLLIGGTFVLFSGIFYFLFMAAWLNVFLVTGRISLITKAAGAVAVAVAAINIKDFFLFKRGVSLSVPRSAQPRLFERMRRLQHSRSSASVLAGTVVLAMAANSYELLCTAGFPMVYTRVLTLNELSPFAYYAYLLAYNVIYVIPLSAIVAVFIVTMGSRKLSEWAGRKLKLISGLMMLALGMVLLLKPAMMNDILFTLWMLASALITAALIIAIFGRLYPEWRRH